MLKILFFHFELGYIIIQHSSNVIEVSRLTKDYGFGIGVFDVSIHVSRGEVFGFWGPNGAGKSTTILISGNGNIGDVKNSIQDTIITKEIDAQMEKRALTYYANADDGLERFDELFSENASDTLTYLVWVSNMPNQSVLPDSILYAQALNAWKAAMPILNTDAGREFASEVDEWLDSMPQHNDFSDILSYASAVSDWSSESPATQENAVTMAYSAACEDMQSYIKDRAAAAGYEKESDEENEMLGSVMYALNPNGMFNDFYTDNGEDAPSDYDIMTLIAHISLGDVTEYISSDERSDYRRERAEDSAAVFLAGNMSKDESVDALMEALSSYGVTEEKYESFGYTYASVRHMAKTAIVTYRGRLGYELDALEDKYLNGDFESETAYLDAISEKKEALRADISSSFLSTLPTEVSDALEEIGQADLYTLIVGSIFYKLAGLLLPIIYMIMASNNLIAGQVDSGSMAYVLSTSTKRATVVFTQAVYLIGSLLAMFSFTTVT